MIVVCKVFEIVLSKDSNRYVGLKITIDGQDFPRPCLNRFSDTVPLVWLDAARNITVTALAECSIRAQETSLSSPRPNRKSDLAKTMPYPWRTVTSLVG